MTTNLTFDRENADALAQAQDAERHLSLAIKRFGQNARGMALRHVTQARGRLFILARILGCSEHESRIVDILEKDIDSNRRRADGLASFVTKLKTWKRGETNRARAAEDLLREGERLLRNDPTMQRWRRKAGDHLDRYRGPYTVRDPDLPTLRLVVEGLGQVYSAEVILVWLITPSKLLDGHRPCDVWDRGERARVVEAVERIAADTAERIRSEVDAFKQRYAAGMQR